MKGSALTSFHTEYAFETQGGREEKKLLTISYTTILHARAG